MFRMHTAPIRREEQDKCILSCAISAAALVELPANSDDARQLRFKCNWVTKVLSSELQKMLITGLRDLRFPADCIAEAVKLLRRTANLVEL
jgi:hypothetical protein